MYHLFTNIHSYTFYIYKVMTKQVNELSLSPISEWVLQVQKSKNRGLLLLLTKLHQWSLPLCLFLYDEFAFFDLLLSTVLQFALEAHL